MQPINWNHGAIKPPPLSLYVHLPWCVQKCPYCDFNSHRAARKLPEKKYIAALLADAEKTLPDIWGRRIVSVFLGGGTPSLFSPSAVDDLFCGLRALLFLSPDIETTMEANPGAADGGKLREFCALGINRLSLGAQSFDDASLKILGRIHDGKTAMTTAATAVDIFPQVNLDLMHALPNQTIKKAAADVQTALSFSPSHLSLYQLTLETGTPFYKNPPKQMPDDDDAADIGDAVFAAAEKNGFERYEISAFAKNGNECRHNLNYWRFGDYLGIGAGAHSKLCINGEMWRRERTRQPDDYMRRALGGDSVCKREKTDGQNRAFEFMLNAFRLLKGFSPSLFCERTGMTINDIEKPLAIAEEKKLITRTAVRIAPTKLGVQYHNDLLQLFLPPENLEKIKTPVFCRQPPNAKSAAKIIFAKS